MDYKKLEEENKMLRAKLDDMKEYKKTYFQTVHKHKTYYCKCCDKEIKYNSMWYHNSSKKHLENKNKIDTDIDKYYEDNIK
jgi:phage-related tail protein